MYTLALDTSEARGSVALLRAGNVLAVERHQEAIDYSEWLLLAVDELLSQANIRFRDVELLGVATGPGSFTGLRVGLTTVKAWAEVFGKPVVGVSRLEAMVHSTCSGASLLAAYYDARRGHVFGTLYGRVSDGLVRVEDEMVISPEEFLAWVDQRAGGERVSWVSLDPELLTSLRRWSKRSGRGDTMTQCSPDLAIAIGRLAEERGRNGIFSDPLELDANYVRRSDAEIFWKGR